MRLSGYILQVLSVRSVLSDSPKTGAEFIAYWQTEGVINSRLDILDSQVPLPAVELCSAVSIKFEVYH